MHLNREAGRSFKDLSQYPVGGWVGGEQAGHVGSAQAAAQIPLAGFCIAPPGLLNLLPPLHASTHPSIHPMH